MKKNLSERIAMLEEMGIDTSKFNINLEGLTLNVVADNAVKDKQIDNKVFRRWVTAQTFKMLYEPSYNPNTRIWEYGWDNYLRNGYSYMYQFTMMLEEIKTLAKIEVKDEESFDERSRFFTPEVVTKTCIDYLDKFNEYVSANYNKKKDVIKLAKYGNVNAEKCTEIRHKLSECVEDMVLADSYSELYAHLKKFVNEMVKLPFETTKCKEWKTAFRSIGAYESLKNMILFHDCVLIGCVNKKESMDKLAECLETYKGEYWRFHYMLKDTIEYNHFDLRESIRKHS